MGGSADHDSRVCAPVIARIEHESAAIARLTFAMARHAVVDLCAVFRLQPEPPPVDRLSAPEEQRLARFLAGAGLRLRTDRASMEKPSVLRASYEPYVYALSAFLLMQLPAWMPPEDDRQGSHTMP